MDSNAVHLEARTTTTHVSVGLLEQQQVMSDGRQDISICVGGASPDGRKRSNQTARTSSDFKCTWRFGVFAQWYEGRS